LRKKKGANHEAPSAKNSRMRRFASSQRLAAKGTFQRIWNCFNYAEAESFFNRWYSWAIRCRLAPVKDVARMLKAHLEQFDKPC
jgi:hypothetical protein